MRSFRRWCFGSKSPSSTGEQIHAIALRCQIQIEPRQRHYRAGEESQLVELFGEPDRWSDTLRTLLWTQASLMVPGFQGKTAIDLPITCTYDFEVVAAKYLAVARRRRSAAGVSCLAELSSRAASSASASSKSPGKKRPRSVCRFGFGASSWTAIFPAAHGSGSDAKASMRSIGSKGSRALHHLGRRGRCPAQGSAEHERNEIRERSKSRRRGALRRLFALPLSRHARRKISCAGSSAWSCRATTARAAPASRGRCRPSVSSSPAIGRELDLRLRFLQIAGENASSERWTATSDDFLPVDGLEVEGQELIRVG